MRTCPFCGAVNADDAELCIACGKQLTFEEKQNSLKTDKPEKQSTDKKHIRTDQPQSRNQKNGGLVAWAVLTLLLCNFAMNNVQNIKLLHILFFLPGLGALAQAVNAGSCDGEAWREARINAIMLCIVGTLMSVILFLGVSAHWF